MPSAHLARKIFHDIFGSFSNLEGNISLLHDIQSHLNPADGEIIGMLARSSHRLYGEMLDLADILAVEGDYIQLKQQTIEADAFLKELQLELKQRMRWEHTEFTVSGGQGMQILSDPLRLKRILAHFAEFILFIHPRSTLVTCEIQKIVNGGSHFVIMLGTSSDTLSSQAWLQHWTSAPLTQAPEEILQQFPGMYLAVLLETKLECQFLIEKTDAGLFLKVVLAC